MTNTKQLLPDNINPWLTENYGWLHNIEVEGDMFETVQRIIAEALDMKTNDPLEWDEEYIKSLQEEKLQTK